MTLRQKLTRPEIEVLISLINRGAAPFYRLTEAGAHLALAIIEKRKTFHPAPRGIPGAEQVT